MIAAGSLTVSMLAIVGWTTTFGQPNFLAGYLTVTLPFIWETLRNRWSKIAVIFPIAAIVITKSWGGILGIIIFFIYLIAKKFSRSIQLAVVSSLGIIMIFAADCLSFLFPNQYYLHRHRSYLLANPRDCFFIRDFSSISK